MTIAVVLSATTALGGYVAANAASPTTTSRADGSSSAQGSEAALPARTVTLLTGDRVVVSTSTDGRRTATVLHGPGREHMVVRQQAVGDALYVVPADVAPLVPEVLDRDLFDVAKLADIQHDDGHRTDVPVILASAGGPAAPASSARTSAGAEPDWAALGVEPEHRLESIGAVSARLDADGAGDLLDALRATHPGGGAGVRAMARAAAGRVPAAAERAAGRVAHVYLDEPVESSDADSMPQIGAPAAWDAGHTGEGVTVAVLDSGVDVTHPDLDQSIVGSRDFTGSGGVTDHDGHGTHVGSIVAGSGEASGGANQGVAPGADLLFGKVTDGYDDEESTVIAGMEWAAAQGADIVNMSLNFGATDGTDPLATAVNELTAQHDTLFVVSAGNRRTNGSIGSPGTADAALTVGSVDDHDVLAATSSKGPRVGDGAIKPDVTAPGVGIVAARAAGTSMGTVVNEWYTEVGGTSMAAPHAAGAAAVLKSAHPGWGADELKARLMGSARPGPAGTTVWDEGAGRVWIPGALDLPATAQPASLSFGALETGRDGAATKPLTYANPSDQDLELALSTDFRGPDGAPVDGGVTLGTEVLTVPAGGTASVDVTLDNSVGPVGRYSGAVTATVVGGPSAGATVRTALGYEKLPERFDLTIRTEGRDGEPMDGWSSLSLMNLDDHTRYSESFDVFDGELTVRVPAGTYGVVGALSEGDYDTWQFDAVTGVADADVRVTDDTTVTLSAEGAMPVSVSTPRPAEAVRSVFSYLMLDEHGRTNIYPYDYGVSGETELYLADSGAATAGEVRLMNLFVLREPVEAGHEPTYTYDLAFQHQVGTDLEFDVRRDELATVRTGYGHAPQGATAWVSSFAALPGFPASFGLSDTVAPGTARTEYLLAGDIEWTKRATFDEETEDGDIVDHGAYESAPTSYVAGSRYTTVFGGAVHSSSAQVRDSRENLLVTLSGWTDGDDHWSSLWDADHRVRLWQDGELVSDTQGARVVVPMPQEPTPLRLEYSGTRDDGWPTAPRVTGVWEFTAGPAGELDSLLPLLDVDYAVAGLGLDGIAPRRTTITIDARASDGGAGSAATSAQVRWSSDDGATWHRAVARPKGDGTFVLTVAAPSGAEQISLDVEASNPQGSVHETTIGAYQVGQPAAGLRVPGS
ncbi:S8 family serine peptidase [Promicromonospora sp. MS192]|uniref:S8 family serine peptidase n=1 Tax=Promicromonospora sp. MS192 TaxID=3412684 RepID=UPI003C2D135B